MRPLTHFLIEAKSAGLHCADPAFRRIARTVAQRYDENVIRAPKPAMLPMLAGLVRLLDALPGLDDPDAIQKTGSAISLVVDALRSEMPKPHAPARRVGAGGDERFYWQERDSA